MSGGCHVSREIINIYSDLIGCHFVMKQIGSQFPCITAHSSAGRVPRKYIIKFLEDCFQHPEKAISQRIPSKTYRSINPTASSSSWNSAMRPAAGEAEARPGSEGARHLGDGGRWGGGKVPGGHEGSPCREGRAGTTGWTLRANPELALWPAWRLAEGHQEARWTDGTVPVPALPPGHHVASGRESLCLSPRLLESTSFPGCGEALR